MLCTGKRCRKFHFHLTHFVFFRAQSLCRVEHILPGYFLPGVSSSPAIIAVKVETAVRSASTTGLFVRIAVTKSMCSCTYGETFTIPVDLPSLFFGYSYCHLIVPSGLKMVFLQLVYPSVPITSSPRLLAQPSIWRDML